MTFSKCTHKNPPLAILWLLCSLMLFSACAPTPAPVLRPTSSPSLQAAATPAQTSTPTLALPSDPSATPVPPDPKTCTETSGRSESLAVVSPALSGALQARVHLPPCYESTGKTRYPVLYLLHGQGFTSDQWERLGFFNAADKRVLAGGQPFIIVLPAEEDTTANPFESGFGSALSSALVPQVDVAYATCTQRTCRAIGGLSRGASWAVYIGLKNWGQFGVIGAHSFPPFFGLDREMPGLLRSIAPGQTPRIYLDIGFDDPYRAPAAAFEDLLTQYGIPHEYYLNAGGHDEAYWSKHVPAYIEWYGSQFGLERLP